MHDRIAKIMVKRVLDNKRHITEHGKYKLILGDDFYYRFYINSKLKLITPDEIAISSLIACYIDYDIRGLLLDD